ncbi:MAG: hypothetical protein VB046_09765 [Paludibacter sp.]|nr:hypothetical protein [Paludibacter sp.]
MIQITAFKEFFESAIVWANAKADTEITGGKTISSLIMAVEENHLIKKIKDKAGIVLAIKYPSSDSQGDEDGYAERNKCLIYCVTKWDPGKVTDAEETNHYSVLQELTRRVKEYLNTSDKGPGICGVENGLYSGFRTEWEYNIFGGYYGLSVSFDLRNFTL